jgi:hypothetical protein
MSNTVVIQPDIITSIWTTDDTRWWSFGAG